MKNIFKHFKLQKGENFGLMGIWTHLKLSTQRKVTALRIHSRIICPQ
jgi:hypothetical protein